MKSATGSKKAGGRRKMKIKVEFYADTFRQGEIDVPDWIKPKSEEAHYLIEKVINLGLKKMRIYPQKKIFYWIWKLETKKK